MPLQQAAETCQSAPGRTRTCDPRLRRPGVSPLFTGDLSLMSHRWARFFATRPIYWCSLSSVWALAAARLTVASATR